MFWRKQKFDNRGMSLLEVLCSVAILAIVSTTIGGAMVVASSSYQRGAKETALQQEAQFTINSIESLIIDATDKVEYDGSTLKITNTDYIYEISTDLSDGTNPKLVYTYTPAGGGTGGSGILAEHVQGFEVDLTGFEKSRNAKITLFMERGSSTVASTYTITARNKPISDEEEKTATIVCSDYLTLEPGQTYPFGVLVSGSLGISTMLDDAITWVDDSGIPVTPNINAVVTSAGVNITVLPGEDGGSEGHYNMVLKTKQKDAMGNPLATQTVKVQIRRVKGFDVSSPIRLESGNDYKEGAIYVIDNTEALGYNLTMDVGQKWDSAPYSYVSPYITTWSSDADDCIEILPVGTTTDQKNNTCRFKLKRDLAVGEKVHIIATSNHSMGANKTGTVYGPVKGVWELESGTRGPISFSDWSELCRNTENRFRDTYPYPPGAYPVRYYRYREAYRDSNGNIDSYGPWCEWREMQEHGTGESMNTLNSGETADMAYEKDYQMQFDCTYVLGGVQVPSAGERAACTDLNNAFRTTVDFQRLGIEYVSYMDTSTGHLEWNGYWNEWVCDSYPLGSSGVGSFASPVVLKKNTEYQFKYRTKQNYLGNWVVFGARRGILQEKMEVKGYKWTGSGWMEIDQNKLYKQIMEESLSLTIREGNSGDVFKVVMNYKNGTPYACEATGEGIFYLKLQ